jgi:hypothetical protein
VHLERGVVEVAARPALHERGDGLIGDAVQPDEVAAGAERQPVEVDRRGDYDLRADAE